VSPIKLTEGKGGAEEENHTTKRKPGPFIKHSILSDCDTVFALPGNGIIFK
jgi:hypothetical protein